MMRKTVSAAAAAAAIAAGLVGMSNQVAHAAPTVTVYDATTTPLPGNVASQGFEAGAISEFGDEVTLAGEARRLSTVTVTLSSWGCQSGAWNTGDCSTTRGAKEQVPITLNIYRASTPNPDGASHPAP